MVPVITSSRDAELAAVMARAWPEDLIVGTRRNHEPGVQVITSAGIQLSE
jgi:hypothetical protein